jgi:hypothetical protein
MELEVPRVWLRLEFRVDADGQLSLTVTDDRGRSASADRGSQGWVPAVLPAVGLPEPVVVRVPQALGSLLSDAVFRLPATRVGTTLRPAVPVFVSLPASLDLLISTAAIDQLLAQQVPIATDARVLIHHRTTSSPVSPFTLPLDLVASGDRGPGILETFDRSPWVQADQGVQSHLASSRDIPDVVELAEYLAEHDVDLIVLDASAAQRLSAAQPAAGRQSVLRAVVVLAEGNGGLLDGAGAAVPWARSTFLVKGPPDAEQFTVLQQLLVALSHDLPLHDALVFLRNGMATPNRVQLFASPDSLHDLRLTSAWSAIERSLAGINGTVGQRAGEDEAHLSEAMPQADPSLLRRVVDDVAEVRRLNLDFAFESRGLLPLASAWQRLVSAFDGARLLRNGGQNGAQVPSAAAQDPQPRVVNLGLRRGAEVLAAPNTGSTYVDPSRSLVAGGRYELDVQIGAAWQASLVVGEPPAIDLLLPDDRRGHDLHVSVFGEKVRIEGPATRVLRLPPAGPSEVISFAVVMPVAEGPVHLRVSVYYRQNLLQTFRLDGLVAAAEQVHAEPILVAELDHSATHDWGNLDELGRRALSLTLNTDGRDGHQLYIKGLKVAATVRVDVDREDNLMKDIRQVLTESVEKTRSPQSTVWALAELGRSLFGAVFSEVDDAAAEALRTVSRSTDETLQVVRANTDRAVGWPLVYDWLLPDVMFGGPEPEVCFGRGMNGGPCGHSAADGVVCVLGFWGLRHRLEELLADPVREDMPIDVAVRNPNVLVALGVDDDATKSLAGRLSSAGTAGVHVLGPQDSLLADLWKPDRPGIVIVLGHHETRDLVGEPQGARIELLTADRWLRGGKLIDQAQQQGRWRPPHSVVLLLSCRSAAAAPTEMTTFLKALQGARAGAVIGTECDVFSDVAVEFATALLTSMFVDGTGPGSRGRSASFAEAVRRARQSIVVDRRDPVGFAFDAFGPADLRLTRA